MRQVGTLRLTHSSPDSKLPEAQQNEIPGALGWVGSCPPALLGLFKVFVLSSRVGVCFQARGSCFAEAAGEAGDTLQDGALIFLFEVNLPGWVVSLLY